MFSLLFFGPVAAFFVGLNGFSLKTFSHFQLLFFPATFFLLWFWILLG
jgi:hypothetical protein